MQNAATGNRKALSLRVPHALAEKVENYAREHGLRKTDAYIHFLEAGLNQDDWDIQKTLSGIDNKLDSLRALLSENNVALKQNELDTQMVLDAIADVASRFPGIERVWLFGSFARGQQGPGSDIDIRLELDRETGFNLHDLAYFSKMIEQATGRDCDVITSRTIKSESLAAAIERDGIRAYER